MTLSGDDLDVGVSTSVRAAGETSTIDLLADEYASPSAAVIDAVATLTERSPIDIEPLFEAVDPDALDALFGTTLEGTRSGTVDFEFAGCAVSVEGTRRVTVESLERAE